eukprot:Sspe_Gene.26451::Locus_10969_Transcript_1_1_Confidence_1.000_Length_954::g.26451::m.26451
MSEEEFLIEDDGSEEKEEEEEPITETNNGAHGSDARIAPALCNNLSRALEQHGLGFVIPAIVQMGFTTPSILCHITDAHLMSANMELGPRVALLAFKDALRRGSPCFTCGALTFTVYGHTYCSCPH